MTVLLETIYGPRILFEGLKFWNLIFLNCTNDLRWKNDQRHFVVDNYFIRNHL
jgi:hypothetical protein